MLVFLLACAPTTDAEGYLAAVAEPDNPALCDAITDSWLAGECRAMAASTRAGQDDLEGGLAICRKMPESDPWRDECFFLVSDRITAAGEQAKTICDQAGRYQDRCLGHALGREGRAMLQDVAPGEELDAYRALREKSAIYFDDEQTAARKLWHMMVEFVASRDIDQPFSAATCGQLQENICRSGFLTRLRFAVRDAHGTEQTLHDICRQRPVQVEVAVAAGMPAWTADADGIAQSAWKRLCGG